jgi:hypothetical protein
MLAKTITFTDYEGTERTETHYFNLDKAELTKWLTTTGEYTLDKVLLRLANERNGAKIMEIFEDLIHRSYGIKSLDGRKFEKNEEIWLNFYQTEAYSNLFMEIVTDANKASAFVNGIIPKKLADEVAKSLKENKDGLPDEIKDYIPKDPDEAPATSN